MWKTKLMQMCEVYKIEPKVRMNKVIFICPKMPEEGIRVKLVKLLPDNYSYDFHEEPKSTTKGRLDFMAMGLGGVGCNLEGNKPKHPIIKVLGLPEGNREQFEEEANKILSQDSYYESWVIKMDDCIRRGVRSVTLPTVHRDTSISKDDIMNVKIALGNCKDVLEFTAMI